MAETAHDNNNVPTFMGVLNTYGVTPTRLKIDPTTHILNTSDGTSGSDLGNDLAARDNSGFPVAIAVSNADGKTPTPLYIDSSGNLLIQSS